MVNSTSNCLLGIDKSHHCIPQSHSPIRNLSLPAYQ